VFQTLPPELAGDIHANALLPKIVLGAVYLPVTEV